MKKNIISILIAVVMVFSVAGCGSQEAPKEESAKETSEAAEAGDAGDSAAQEGSSEWDGGKSFWDETSEDEEFGMLGKEKIEKQVLYDENGFKMTVVGLTKVAYYPVLELIVENNTGRTLSFYLENISLNGWEWDESLCLYDEKNKMVSEENELTIADGETMECGIGFFNTHYYEMCRIRAFAEIGFRVTVYDETESYSEFSEFLQSPDIILETSAAAKYTDSFHTEEFKSIYEENDIRVLAMGQDPDPYDSIPTEVFYVENNSDRTIIVTCPKCIIDGNETDAYFSAIVRPGFRGVAQLGYDSSITEVNEIKAVFRTEVFSIGDDRELIGESEEITFHPVKIEE